MDEFAASIRFELGALEREFERFTAEQADHLALGKSIDFKKIGIQDAVKYGAFVTDIDPEESIEAAVIRHDSSSVPYGNGKFKDYGSARGSSWGGFRNGAIPLSALKPIGKQDKHYQWYRGFYWLKPAAADSWLALKAHANKDGINLTVTSAYRTVQHQSTLQAGGRAAKPGNSPHGLAVALDIGELYFPGTRSTSVAGSARMRETKTYKWLEANGSQYGWINPIALKDGVGLDEAWHWEYVN